MAILQYYTSLRCEEERVTAGVGTLFGRNTSIATASMDTRSTTLACGIHALFSFIQTLFLLLFLRSQNIVVDGEYSLQCISLYRHTWFLRPGCQRSVRKATSKFTPQDNCGSRLQVSIPVGTGQLHRWSCELLAYNFIRGGHGTEF